MHLIQWFITLALVAYGTASQHSFSAEPPAELTIVCFGGDKRSIPLDIACEIIDAQRLEQAQPHVTGSILDIPHTIGTLDTFLAYQMTPSNNRARWFAKLSDQRQADLFDISHWLDTKTFDQLVQKNSHVVLNARPSEHPYVRFICKDSSVDVTQDHFESLLGKCREGNALHSFKALSNDFASNESRAISLDCTSKTIAMIVADTLSNKKLFALLNSLKISEKIELIKTVDYLGHVQDEAVASHFVSQELLPKPILDRALSWNYPACLGISGIDIIKRAFIKQSLSPLAEIFHPPITSLGTIDIDEATIASDYTGSHLVIARGQRLEVWDTINQTREVEYRCPRTIGKAMFSPDGTFSIAWSGNGSVVVVDNRTKKQRSITLPQVNFLALVACSDDNSQLCCFDDAALSPSKNNRLIRIDIQSILNHKEPEPHYPPDQDDNDWDISDWLPQAIINSVVTPNRMNIIMYRPGTHEVAAGGRSRIVIWNDKQQSRPITTLGSGNIKNMKFTQDGSRLIWIESNHQSFRAWTIKTSTYQSPELIDSWTKVCPWHIGCDGDCLGIDSISKDGRFLTTVTSDGRQVICLDDNLRSRRSNFARRDGSLNPRYPYWFASGYLFDNRSTETIATINNNKYYETALFSGDGNRFFGISDYPIRSCSVFDLTKLNKFISSSFNDWSLAQLMALCGLYYRSNYRWYKNPYLTPIEKKNIERLFDIRFEDHTREVHMLDVLRRINKKNY